jgi:hypothetical protein
MQEARSQMQEARSKKPGARRKNTLMDGAAFSIFTVTVIEKRQKIRRGDAEKNLTPGRKGAKTQRTAQRKDAGTQSRKEIRKQFEA